MIKLSPLILGCALVASTPVHADDVETAPVIVRPGDDGERSAPAERALEESPFVTVVELASRHAEGLQVAEVLAESVGVSIRTLGGLGSFASVSIRGASAGQTEVLVDGVPLSRLGTASVDVGSLDLGTFDAVEIYRGGVPASLAGGGLGGAVVLRTRPTSAEESGRTVASLAVGSAFRSRLRRGDRFGDGYWSRIAAGTVGAPGDFEYHDDGATPLNPDDDVTRRRVNNAFHQVDGVVRVGREGGRPFVAGVRATAKRQGVPGQTGRSAEEAQLGTVRLLGDGEHTRLVGARGGVGVRGHLLFESQRWQNPNGDVGLRPDDKRYRTYAAGATGWGTLLVGEAQLFRLGLDARLERFGQRDLVDDTTAGGTRFGGALSLTDEILLGAGERWAIVPSLRLELLTTRGDGERRLGEGAPESADELELSPRLGIRYRASDAVSLKANGGRYFRAPTVVELFGDRGFLVGNGGLRAEGGWTADLGVVVAPRRVPLFLEATGFLTRATNLIVLLPTSGRRSRAQNLGAATLGGGELALTWRALPGLGFTGNYTLVLSAQDSPLVAVDGNTIPGRPQHEAGLRVDGRRELAGLGVSAWGELTLVSGNYLDEGNLEELPPRRLVGAGVRVAFGARGSLALDVKNLLDSRVHTATLPDGRPVDRALADVLGYPLPGRSFLVTAELVL
jgi:vitamin B12 transporter